MVDDVLINKAASILQCAARAGEEYAGDPDGLATNFTRQYAAILTIHRARKASVVMGMQVNRCERLGVKQSARNTLTLLEQRGWITLATAEHMKRKVGFRNLAVHDYQTLQLPTTLNILQHHMDDFLAFSCQLVLRDQA